MIEVFRYQTEGGDEPLGAGYRVYFGRQGRLVVILLCGGSKKSQPEDIKAAKTYWKDWKRRQE